VTANWVRAIDRLFERTDIAASSVAPAIWESRFALIGEGKSRGSREGNLTKMFASAIKRRDHSRAKGIAKDQHEGELAKIIR